MERITLPTKSGFDFVQLIDIIYLQSSGNYCLVFLVNVIKPIHVFRSLKQFETLLIENNFIRIHNEYLIHLLHLIRYDKAGGGVVEMSNGKKIEVSRGRKKEFFRLIKGK